MENAIWNTIIAIKCTIGAISSLTKREAMNAAIRAKNTTNVFTTPCNNVIVTMSPLAMWATSWAITPSTASSSISCNKPEETATRERFLEGPVANAFTSGEW
jgi:hypothetical protein